MDTSRLNALIAIADTGSITGAAARLNTTRPTILRRIEELEAWVGVRLTGSSGSGTELTPEAVRLTMRARGIVREARELRELFRAPSSLAGEHRGVVSQGIPPPVLAHLAPAFQALSPHARIRAEYRADPIAEMRAGAEFAIVIGPVDEQGPWRKFTVLRMPVRLLASQDYLDKHGAPETLDELGQHTLLHWVRRGETSYRLPLLDGTTAPVSPWLASSDGWFIQKLAETGTGIALTADGPPPPGDPPGPSLVHLLPDVVGGECVVQFLSSRDVVGLSTASVLSELAKSLLGRLRKLAEWS